MSRIRLVATDLDGTLLSTKGDVSPCDLETLRELGRRGITRVVATGRSPYSFSRVIPNDFPIDYLVFSSGAGAMSWTHKDILYSFELTPGQVQDVAMELVAHGVDFMVHDPVPTNHRFLYHANGSPNPDFFHRLQIYEQHGRPFLPGITFDSPASQVIAILPHNPGWFNSLKERFPTLKVIRATSPLNGHSIWMEIFPANVSKANGILWICNSLGIEPHQVASIGNDYNDIDMLQAFPASFVVGNAPQELREQFAMVGTNDQSGFSQMVSKVVLPKS